MLKLTQSNWVCMCSSSNVPPFYVLSYTGCNEDEDAKHFMNDEGEELCDNVTYLGKSGLFTSTSGLSVAYLSGKDGADKDDFSHFSASDVQALKTKITSAEKFKGVDILLTSVWPQGVSLYGVELNQQPKCDSSNVAKLAMALKPRYHFAGIEGISYERNPYRNHKLLSGQSGHVSRFVALAAAGNKEKQKYLYAFNITPMKYIDREELHRQPPDTTECPYKMTHQEMTEARQAAGGPQRNEFFYGQSPAAGNKRHGTVE